MAGEIAFVTTLFRLTGSSYAITEKSFPYLTIFTHKCIFTVPFVFIAIVNSPGI